MRLFAQLISWLLHPLLLPTYALLLLFGFSSDLFAGYERTDQLRLLLLLVNNTLLFPAAAIALLWRLGFITHLHMPQARQRLLPYLTSGIFYLWTYVVLRRSDLPDVLPIMMLGATLTLFVCFFINLFSKISIHTGGAGALLMLTVLASLMSPGPQPYLPMSVAVAGGLVGSARLWLGAHTLTEVLAGYLIGMLSQVAAFWVL
ncbi:MAG: hypothetical protein RMK52_09820 [Chitinophagales bacterium]|nr:hypothetical protein [Chitinophagales bacterium]MDW8394523.1 hypothetical protein [Chitinophagales bacterium]